MPGEASLVNDLSFGYCWQAEESPWILTGVAKHFYGSSSPTCSGGRGGGRKLSLKHVGRRTEFLGSLGPVKTKGKVTSFTGTVKSDPVSQVPLCPARSIIFQFWDLLSSFPLILPPRLVLTQPESESQAFPNLSIWDCTASCVPQRPLHPPAPIVKHLPSPHLLCSSFMYHPPSPQQK